MQQNEKQTQNLVLKAIEEDNFEFWKRRGQEGITIENNDFLALDEEEVKMEESQRHPIFDCSTDLGHCSSSSDHHKSLEEGAYSSDEESIFCGEELSSEASKKSEAPEESMPDTRTYTAKDFLHDLCRVFTEGNENSTNLFYSVPNMFDEKLGRSMSLFEQIICLANGILLPSFVRLLVYENDYIGVLRPIRPGSIPDYDTYMTVLSMLTGEFTEFERYGKSFTKAFGMMDTGRACARQEAIQVLMLVKGISQYVDATNINAGNQEYEAIFKSVFKKNHRKAMMLHELATLKLVEVKDMILSNSIAEETSEVKKNMTM